MAEPRRPVKRCEPVRPVQLTLPLVPKAGCKLLPFRARRPAAVEDWLLHEFLQGREEPRPKVHRP